ncbi:glucose-6-phosphate isomerase [Sneathiella litorea]|uniref:Glucose-6-phosphate isomerase n=1 Tax=Sneathiella litorea TaxID=2606216 RepID=A0A6L8W2A3_9PROT|nr:glucose-6-phosphate isomerase [Sneathiella litorea]MZR29165.1 glucose-6-phosphate isomerase [Sneathiella litorea]
MDEDIWSRLAEYYERIKDTPLVERFARDPERFQNFSITLDDMLLDFSKTSLDETACSLLLELACATDLENKRDAMFNGEPVNRTENRAALHTALRNRSNEPVFVENKDVMPEVNATLASMAAFAEGVRSGITSAHDGAAFTDVVNIGIGGSDLGPAMATPALAPYHDGPRLHFVSNADGAEISDLLKQLDPGRTLFIISSKSFTTIETMTNAATAKKWMTAGIGEKATEHFAAVSTALDKTTEFGIAPDMVFSFGDWVGGRYSVWGPIGLSLMIAIGQERFAEFLQGGHDMDQHFRSAPLHKNIPVMLGLVGIWHNNICGYESRAVLPYDQRLARLPAYLQQLDMESNGKSVTLTGDVITRKSGPVVWGEAGTNGQHAFYQLIHQGSQIIPCEFLVAAQSHEENLPQHHRLLLANCLAQSEALMRGRNRDEATERLRAQGAAQEDLDLAIHQVFPGNRPSTTLIYRKLTPRTLGRIIALYEHRVFVEGAIWGVNSFDQWGVELGKELAATLLPLIGKNAGYEDKDGSTQGLLQTISQLRGD